MAKIERGLYFTMLNVTAHNYNGEIQTSFFTKLGKLPKVIPNYKYGPNGHLIIFNIRTPQLFSFFNASSGSVVQTRGAQELVGTLDF